MSDGTILMSFANLFNSGGTTYNPEDIARFTPTSLGSTTAGSFSMVFDGSAFGLSGTNEDLDDIFMKSDGNIMLSTTGNLATTSGYSAEDEDISTFNPTTSTFVMFIDGSDIALTNNSEDIDAIWMTSGGVIYFSTVGNLSGGSGSTSVNGAGNDIAIFTPTSTGNTTAGNFNSTLHLVGNSNGLSGELLAGFHVIS